MEPNINFVQTLPDVTDAEKIGIVAHELAIASEQVNEARKAVKEAREREMAAIRYWEGAKKAMADLLVMEFGQSYFETKREPAASLTVTPDFSCHFAPEPDYLAHIDSDMCTPTNTVVEYRKCVSMNEPKSKAIADQIRDYLGTLNGATVTVAELGKRFNYAKRCNIDNTLSEMVERGQIERIGRGIYRTKSSDKQTFAVVNPLGTRKAKVLDMVRAVGGDDNGVSSKEIADYMQISDKNATALLNKLVVEGSVIRSNGNRYSPAVCN